MLRYESEKQFTKANILVRQKNKGNSRVYGNRYEQKLKCALSVTFYYLLDSLH